MANILKNRTIQSDAWTVLTLAAGEAADQARLPAGPVLVPLAVWQARREDLIRREWENGTPFGLWLAPGDDVAAIAADLGDFSVIGVNFPSISDGRGYSIATLLRTRYGYGGELRALGAIGRDQLFYLNRVGFDAFSLAEPEGAQSAIAALDDFSEVYQAAANQPLPLFRRPADFALAG